MDLLGRSGGMIPLKDTNYFTCHEALLLPYEEALTRTNPMSDEYYCSSSHFLWIRERTRSIDSAHVEFFRGIMNPIGIKCGPSLESDELIRMLDILNPGNVKGRLTLITRLGRENVESRLHQMIREIQQEGRDVIWVCDPMHGNLIKSNKGVKTRIFAHVVEELQQTIQIHANENTFMGGIHLEMTGEDVTECVGGMAEIEESDLFRRYRTLCEPRLNAKQSIELALLAAEELDKH